jgi:hypothetical protein
MYEINAVMLSILAAYGHESLLACAFVLATNSLLYTATMERKKRIKYGQYCLLALVSAVLASITVKVVRATYIMKNQEVNIDLDSCNEIIEFDNHWTAWGYNQNIIGGWIPAEGFDGEVTVDGEDGRHIYTKDEYEEEYETTADVLTYEEQDYYFNLNPCDQLRGSGDVYMK